MTITKGLIVRLEAKPGQQEAVAAFLRDAVPLVQEEPKTVAWFSFQTGASSFAIVDVPGRRRTTRPPRGSGGGRARGQRARTACPAAADRERRRARDEAPLTMSAATVINRRELAHRVGSGLEVTLYWTAADNSASIEIRHVASETTLRFAVPTDQALDAFYHPLAHVAYSTTR